VTTTNDFRTGMAIELDGGLFRVVEFMHVKPGKGGAFVRSKLKNVRTGKVIEKTWNAGEKVSDVRLDNVEMQYLYNTGEDYYFMNTGTYEQVNLPSSMLEDVIPFLKENMAVGFLMEGSETVAVELPNFVDLEVKETAPGLKGDTVSGGSKPATLETGAVIQVPLFLNPGDVVRVDTRTKAYVSRV
jgi:elongation factor P